MTLQSKPAQAGSARQLRDARRLYRRWTKTLTVYLGLLEAQAPSELANASKHQSALGGHYKTLEKLFDLERDLDGRIDPKGGVELDLDAARAEILARLAAWDDANRTAGVS